MICLKCREEYDGEHECIEEMTLDELFQYEREKIHDQLHPNGACVCAGEGKCDWCLRTDKALVPPGQSPEDEDFKP